MSTWGDFVAGTGGTGGAGGTSGSRMPRSYNTTTLGTRAAPPLGHLHERVEMALRRHGGRATSIELSAAVFGANVSAELRRVAGGALRDLRAHERVGCTVENDVAYWWLYPNLNESDSIVCFLTSVDDE